MPKRSKPQNHIRKPKSFYTVHPWECRHKEDRSEIKAYVEASGNWEVVAEVRNTSGASAETMATFLCNLINDNQKDRSLLLAAMDALQTCLNEANHTFASEQEADRVVQRIKGKIG